MEKKGLQKCLAFLDENGLQLSVLVTDRHPAIQKMMREDYGHVIHSYDIWHVAKGGIKIQPFRVFLYRTIVFFLSYAFKWSNLFPTGYSKKVEALAKQKECECVRPWIKSMVNHMYWSGISTPNGDPDVMESKWKSLAKHIQNIHEDCHHPPLEQTQLRKKKWLKPRKYWWKI